MRRSIALLLACALALATGLALLGAASLVAAPAPTALPAAHAEADPSHPEVVRRFYDVANATLSTGDPTPLAAFLAADFVDRTPLPGIPPTGAGLVRHLLALRATFPDMRLAVEDVQPYGDRVLARVRAEGLGRGAILGVPVSRMPAEWEGLDVFRIAGGRIAERWTAGDWPVLPQPLVATPLARTPAAAFVRLGRLTYDPGASQPPIAALGPQLVVVEAGALTVRVEGKATLARAAWKTEVPAPEGEIVLGAGDALVLTSSARYTARNAGSAPAVVLTLALLPWSAGAPGGGGFLWPEAGLPDVTADLLAEGVAEGLPAGPATLGLGRVTLAAGAEVAAHGAGSPRIAIVEAGALHLRTAAGDAATMSAGRGTLIEPASLPTFRNSGDAPLVLLLATIEPAAPSARG